MRVGKVGKILGNAKKCLAYLYVSRGILIRLGYIYDILVTFYNGLSHAMLNRQLMRNICYCFI